MKSFKHFSVLVAAFIAGTFPGRAAEGMAGYSYFTGPNSPFIQLISDDGVAFLWGEPAYGGTTEADLAPFPLGLAQPLPLPLPPGGGRWVDASASGYQQMLVDDRARVFVSEFVGQKMIALHEVSRPANVAGWTRLDSSGGGLVAQDLSGELWQVTVRAVQDSMNIGEWRQLVRPAGVTRWVKWSAGYTPLALGDDGELYQVGDIFAALDFALQANDFWERVPKPEGVARWLDLDCRLGQSAALGDKGDIYYWGMYLDPRLSQSLFWGVQTHAPVKLPRPDGVTGWTSVQVARRAYLGRDQSGRYFGIGDNAGGLIDPTLGSASFFSEFVPLPEPPDGGLWANITFGESVAIARDESGRVSRWGGFRRAIPIDGPHPVVTPERWELPVGLSDPELRLRPAARIIGPASGSVFLTGTNVEVSADVYAIAGNVSEVSLVVDGQLHGGSWERNGNLATITWIPVNHGDHLLQVRVVDNDGRETLSAGVQVESVPQVSWSLSKITAFEPLGDEPPDPAILTIERSAPQDEPMQFAFTLLQVFGGDRVQYRLEGVQADGSSFVVDFAAGQARAEVRIIPIDSDGVQSSQSLGFRPAATLASRYFPPDSNLTLVLYPTYAPAESGALEIANAGDLSFLVSDESFFVDVRMLKSLGAGEPGLLRRYVNGQQSWYPTRVVLPDEGDYRLNRFISSGEPAGDFQLAVYLRLDDGRVIQSPFVNIHVHDRGQLPEVYVESHHESVLESYSPIIPLVIRRTGDLSRALEASLAGTGSLTVGLDFEPMPSIVEFPAGQDEVHLSLQIVDDAEAEPDEGVRVQVAQRTCTGVAGCYVATPNSAMTVRVRDDDPSSDEGALHAQAIASPFVDSSMLLTASGQLYSWGDFSYGQLGHGDQYWRQGVNGALAWPRSVAPPGDGTTWARIYLNGGFGFGISAQGRGYAWGATPGPGGVNDPDGWLPPTVTAGLSDGFSVLSSCDGYLLSATVDGAVTKVTVSIGNPPQLGFNDLGYSDAQNATPYGWVFSIYGDVWKYDYWQVTRFAKWPLAEGAGCWRDVALVGGYGLLALDDTGRLHVLRETGGQYDYGAQGFVSFYSRQSLPGLPDNRKVEKLHANSLEVVVQDSEGQLWRLNVAAGLGEANIPGASWAEPVPFPDGVTRWTSVAAGRAHFIAIGDDGKVYTWGDNQRGQLGLGNFQDAAEPTLVPLFTNVNDPANLHPVIETSFAPVLRLLTPKSAIQLDGPSDISVQGEASDIDGTINRVEVLANGRTIGSLTYDPGFRRYVGFAHFTEPGMFQMVVRAWDDAGLTADSEAIDVTITDPTLYPVVNVWNIPSATPEGFGPPAGFVISRQGVANVPLTVYFDITGSATEGVDYPALPRSVIIPAGAADVKIPVIARPDFNVEGTEDVNLTIASPGCDPETAEPGSGCYRVGSPATAPVFLLDSIVPGDARLSFVSISSLEPIAREGTTNVARVEIRRNGSVAEDLSVFYNLAGNAENGVDYAPLDGVVVIPAGEAKVDVTISAIEDYLPENFEQVIITLANPGCDVGQGSAAGCYLSDDTSVTVYIGDKPERPPPPPSSGLTTAGALLHPVLFDGIKWLKGQGTVVSVVSDPGARFKIESSSDMVHWNSLGEFTSVSGRIEFLDVSAAAEGNRYYRAIPPPDSP